MSTPNYEPNVIIRTALSDAVSRIKQGSTPTEALEKVADFYDLSEGYIHRVGESLNVALNFNHFKTASDKSTNFPIADIPHVIKKAFTLDEKTASKATHDTLPFRQFGELPDFNKILNNPNYKQGYVKLHKAASEDKPNPTSERGLFEKAAKDSAFMNRELDVLKTEKISAQHTLQNAFSDLLHTFSKVAVDYRTPFYDFEAQVYSKHGEKSAQYLDLLYKSADSVEDRGIHDTSHVMFETCKEARRFDELLKAADELNRATEELRNFEVIHNASKEKLAEINKLKAEHLKKKETSSVKSVQDETEKEIEKESIDKMNPGTLETFLRNSYLPQAPKENPSAKLNSPSDNIARTMMLQRLIMLDPVLSHVNPHTIVEKYEQLLRLAPQLSKEPEVVKALLRLMTSTHGLSSFEADQLVSANTNLTKQKLMHLGLLNEAGKAK